MKRIISILTFCLLGALILSACAQQDLGQISTIVTAAPTDGILAETTPNPPGQATSDPALGGQNIVTLADQGKTINLKVGDNFMLKLGEGHTWNVDVSDQNVLSRVKFLAMIRGAQGVYDALQPGTVTLTASGDPICPDSQPACGLPAITFSVTVVVK
jgi:hypothetical protein